MDLESIEKLDEACERMEKAYNGITLTGEDRKLLSQVKKEFQDAADRLRPNYWEYNETADGIMSLAVDAANYVSHALETLSAKEIPDFMKSYRKVLRTQGIHLGEKHGHC